jgi:hypothetical protein
MWRREIAALNGKVLRPPTKKELRERARRAKSEFDAKQAKAGADSQSGCAVPLEAQAKHGAAD